MVELRFFFMSVSSFRLNENRTERDGNGAEGGRVGDGGGKNVLESFVQHHYVIAGFMNKLYGMMVVVMSVMLMLKVVVVMLLLLGSE